MRATIMYRAGDVRVENVPDAAISKPTDALVRITRACICGSDLWPYHDLEPSEKGRAMGHEAIGVVEAVGKEVRKVKKGDFVVMPFAFSDGDHLICVLSERAPADYLDMLQERGISYVVSGKSTVELRKAVALLGKHFRIRTLLLEGGGHINGAFLQAGLVDELSLLVAQASTAATTFQPCSTASAHQRTKPYPSN